MLTTGQRNARAALDAARASFDALQSPSSTTEERTALLVAAWQGAEDALRALAGTAVLEGLPLVRELRQRNLLTLDDAHALVDLQAASERAKSPGYAPTPADIAAARTTYDKLSEAASREVSTGMPNAGDPRGGSSPVSGLSSPPATHKPNETPSYMSEVTAPAQSNTLGIVLLVVVLLAVVGAGAFYVAKRGNEPDELARGRQAYAAGDRTTAKNSFGIVAGAQPTLAEPHIFLGRIAREEGNFAAASDQLRRAVELEPSSALAMRELAALLLATNQVELARSFYERAIRLNPEDKSSLGYMGCTLARLGRPDLAQRFAARAGPGSWQ
ncbi:MAG: tetratricopeptide repeat protein, partial [Gemmatimonadaceae bacterium]